MSKMIDEVLFAFVTKIEDIDKENCRVFYICPMCGKEEEMVGGNSMGHKFYDGLHWMKYCSVVDCDAMVVLKITEKTILPLGAKFFPKERKIDYKFPVAIISKIEEVISKSSHFQITYRCPNCGKEMTQSGGDVFGYYFLDYNKFDGADVCCSCGGRSILKITDKTIVPSKKNENIPKYYINGTKYHDGDLLDSLFNRRDSLSNYLDFGDDSPLYYIKPVHFPSVDKYIWPAKFSRGDSISITDVQNHIRYGYVKDIEDNGCNFPNGFLGISRFRYRLALRGPDTLSGVENNYKDDGVWYNEDSIRILSGDEMGKYLKDLDEKVRIDKGKIDNKSVEYAKYSDNIVINSIEVNGKKFSKGDRIVYLDREGKMVHCAYVRGFTLTGSIVTDAYSNGANVRLSPMDNDVLPYSDSNENKLWRRQCLMNSGTIG